MKTALIFLVIAILILVLLWFRFDIWFGESTIDIHVHDTYFVIARWHFILLIILVLGTVSSLGGAIGTRLRNKAFVISLLIFLAVDAYLYWSVFHSLSYL